MSAAEITPQGLSISQLRAEAARTADAKQARHILAIAMVLDGHSRLVAAQADMAEVRLHSVISSCTRSRAASTSRKKLVNMRRPSSKSHQRKILLGSVGMKKTMMMITSPPPSL